MPSKCNVLLTAKYYGFKDGLENLPIVTNIWLDAFS